MVTLLSTLIVGATLASCARSEPRALAGIATPPATVTPAGTKPLPMMGNSTRNNPALKKKVDRILRKALGRGAMEAMYNDKEVLYYRLIADNPMLKESVIPAMSCNDFIGRFDMELARAATRKLFAAYEIELEEGVYVEGDGYGFEADGFNRDLYVGFEIRSGEEVSWLYHDSGAGETSQGKAILGANELLELEKDVNRDNVDVFVCTPYDRFTASEGYYLVSVVDYLNWIHGDREIAYRPRAPYEPGSIAVGPVELLWEPESGAAQGRWAVAEDNGHIESAAGASRLLVDLKPGGTAIYRPAAPVHLDAYSLTIFKLAVSQVTPGDIPVDIDLYANGAPGTRQRHTFLPADDREIKYCPNFKVAERDNIGTLETLSITNVNRFPIVLHLVDLKKEDLR